MNDDERSEWLQWRRGGIGGSDIAGLLGLSRYSSPWSIFAEKVGLMEPTESTPRQRIGQRMESVLAELFELERPGLYIAGQQQRCEHFKYPWARCTADAFAHESPTSVYPLALVEFKTDGRFGWPDGPPPNLRAQCVWQMGVTGVRLAFLAVMFAGFRFEVFEIPWDDDAQADWDLMLTTADAFWHRHVVTGVAPAVDGSDATSDALAAVYPEHVPGIEVELDELADMLVERGDLKDRASDIRKRLDEIDNTLREWFGSAEVGTFGGVPILTYRSSERAGYTVPPATIRTLRPAPKPKKGKPS